MNDPIDKKIQQANEQLKKKGTRVVIYQSGNKLCLRGTLPPKPHIDAYCNYSQVVSLGNNAIASDKGIGNAIELAKLLTGQLLTGNFNWQEWIEKRESCP